MAKEAIPLEDDPCNVIKKAMRGLDISSDQLAEKSGVGISHLNKLLEGKLDQSDHDALSHVARALDLDASSLASLPTYRPDPVLLNGLHQIVSPFGHAGVNAYIINHGSSATVIDTGTNAEELFETIRDLDLKITHLLITHRHPDHTACVNDFEGVPIVYPDQLEHHDCVETERGTIKALDVSGHATPAKAFYYDRLDTPLCIVGDSVFAGSMGGTQSPNSYQQALHTAKSHIMNLPENTIIAPGHGPLTTVGEEANNNPFFKHCLNH